jgi:hypothetical protein
MTTVLTAAPDIAPSPSGPEVRFADIAPDRYSLAVGSSACVLTRTEALALVVRVLDVALSDGVEIHHWSETAPLFPVAVI